MAVAKLIEFAEWQKGIAPLWKADEPAHIPIVNNPFQIIQYPVEDWPTRILFFPVAYEENEEIVGYTSLYNISDEVVRIRGIYVLPEHRGRGVGHRMWQAASALFPRSFRRVLGWWREDSAPKFIEHSGMSILPGTDWFWSDYSKVNMRLLYRDRDRVGDDTDSQTFVRANIARYGFGGSNNLNRSWTPEEWATWVAPHAFNYTDGKIDVLA